MATMNEVPVQSNTSYVTVEATKDARPIVPDWYPCHVTKVEVDRRKVKQRHEATIYNLTCTVADEVSQLQYSNKDETWSGDSYAGKKFRSIGFFNYHSPQGAETFEPNPSGNVGYSKLCNAFNVNMPKTVVQIDGKPTEVLTLPELTKDDLMGQPIMVFLGKSKPWIGRDGQERRSYEVKAFKSWEGGQSKQVVVESDDIPF
jgi:hypothetical protein